MGSTQQTQQWEYLEVFVDLDKKSWKDGAGRSRKLKKGRTGAALAELGLEGWELAGTLADGDSDSQARMFFKRPLVEDADAGQEEAPLDDAPVVTEAAENEP